MMMIRRSSLFSSALPTCSSSSVGTQGAFPFFNLGSSLIMTHLHTSMRFQSGSNSNYGRGDEQRLRSMQQLPKVSQIVRGLPSNWRTAEKAFTRHQFLDPTRPPENAKSTSVADGKSASPLTSSSVAAKEQEQFRQQYPHEAALTRELAEQDRRLESEDISPYDEETLEQRDLLRSMKHGRNKKNSSSRSEDEEVVEEGLPLPKLPIARPVADNRLRVALVGGNNVGKSALWNKLCGAFDRAHNRPWSRVPQMVRDEPGLTRDAVEGIAQILLSSEDDEGSSQNDSASRQREWSTMTCIFTLIDTPGVIDGQILAETSRALDSCHAAIFVVSCDRDLGHDEFVLAKHLASMPRLPVISVLSKCDLARHRLTEIQSIVRDSLAMGMPVPVSAYGDSGFDVLGAALRPLADIQARARTYRDWTVEDAALAGDEAALEEVRLRNAYDRPVRIAFVGRSNSGKSSLVNSLVGEYRSRSRPGSKMTTRDTVETECVYRGKKLVLIDTAPTLKLRVRRSRPFLNQLHNATLRAIDYADVVVVVFDAREGHPSGYDMAVAHKCIDEGRPFLFAANRWDEVLDASATAEAIDFKIKRQINEVRYAHAVVTSSAVLSEEGGSSASALSQKQQQAQQRAPSVGLNHALLMREVMMLHDNWNKKVPTRDLTRFWRKLEKSVNVPMKTARIHRILQSHSRPPTFVVRLQSKDREALLKDTFLNLLRNALVEEFGFRGVPIRILQEVKDKYPDVVQ